MAEEKKVKKDRLKWFREMRSELKKVVWPDRKTTAKNTGTLFRSARPNRSVRTGRKYAPRDAAASTGRSILSGTRRARVRTAPKIA